MENVLEIQVDLINLIAFSQNTNLEQVYIQNK